MCPRKCETIVSNSDKVLSGPPNFLDSHKTWNVHKAYRKAHLNIQNSCCCSTGAQDWPKQIWINHRQCCWHVLTSSGFWLDLTKHVMCGKHAEDAHLHVFCDVLPYKETLRMSGKFSLWLLNIRWIVIIIPHFLSLVWTLSERNKGWLIQIRSRSCALHDHFFEEVDLSRKNGRAAHMTWPYLADHIC